MIAFSILNNDPRHYTARPFLISGSCKRETVQSQTDLLTLSVNALRSSSSLPSNLRLYCIATDGDSRRRRALVPLTYAAPLSQTSRIFALLSPLKLFNLMCGIDELTMDFDYKHTAKRFRNTLIRTKGIQIDGISVTPSVVKHHLMLTGHTSDMADALLVPNDKQDVGLMYRLLYAIAELPPSSSSDELSPTARSSRRVLHLLGQLYRLLLDPYSDIMLSLHEQLSKLSAAAHIILALYSQEKGNIMPVQLCFDVLAAIKNVYFSVAKTKVDNPEGNFHLVLLGTDCLEKVFGKVRTMIGTDTNADQLQLANRIDAAVQCVKILEQHPEWGGEARRLKLKPRRTQDGETASPELDHINPRTWQGNVAVRDVVLLTAWQQGRQHAEQILKNASVTSPFGEMDTSDGYDMLCPFGEGRPILISGALHDGEREEDEDEADIPPLVDPTSGPDTAHDDSGELDADDLAATEAASIDSSARSPKTTAFVKFDDTSKPIHKGSVLRIYSDPFAVTNSRDRLKRVRGLAQFNERSSASGVDLQDLEDAQAVVAIEDPVATLVRCNNLIFVAVLEVTAIRVDTTSIHALAANRIHEPNIHFRGRIMNLVPRDSSHQPSGPDWEWNGRCVKGLDLDDIDGALIELVDPILKPALCDEFKGTETTTFRTSELLSIGALLLERSTDIGHRVRTMNVCPEFPYRNSNGE